MTKLSNIEVEETLLASRGRTPEVWRKPERDLSTPRGRLLAVRDVVVGTPADKINMLDLKGRDGCGCALYHARLHGVLKNNTGGGRWRESFGISEAEADHLFTLYSEIAVYPQPTGAPAKAEFLRRIDAILATHADQPRAADLHTP